MKKALIFIILLLLVGAGAYYLSERDKSSVVTKNPVQQEPYVVPALSQPYKNDEFKFSLNMPADFKAIEQPNDNGGKTIVLQDAKSNGIQITVTPFDEDVANLTADRIHQDVPDLKISEAQPVEIGLNHTGLAFKSDNAAYDGASRDVWFVFRGNLYQISTYQRLDDLLKAVFATWKFQ